MTFGSCFANIGGIDLGFERAGLVCAWQVENHPFAQRVLKKHWPLVKRHDDIRTFQPDESWRVDLVAGGFPCTQTSNAAAVHGGRSGLAGKDSGLWFEMLRVVRILRPEFVVVENVGGASTWQAEITAGLASAGYRVPDRPLALPAACLGAPHLRRRLFWIADVDGKGLEITRQFNASSVECDQRRAANRNDWLATITGICGMDDGLPNRLDRRERIERCGLAVVPAVAEYIGRRILAAATTP